MEVKITTEGAQIHMLVSGSIDEIGAQKLEDCFNKLDLKSAKEVLFNFKQVTYIGSAGVGILLLLYKKLALHNGRIIIESIPKELYSLLADDMNLGRVFTLSSL